MRVLGLEPLGDDLGDPVVVDAGLVQGGGDALSDERLGEDPVDGGPGGWGIGVAGGDGALGLLGRIEPGLEEVLEALPLPEGEEALLGPGDLPQEALLAELDLLGVAPGVGPLPMIVGRQHDRSPVLCLDELHLLHLVVHTLPHGYIWHTFYKSPQYLIIRQWGT